MRAFLHVWKKKKGNGQCGESARHKGWCNEVIILLLSTVRKLSQTLIDVSGRIIWHFHTVARTQLEMSDCPAPPLLPSLSTLGALRLMRLGELVCAYVPVGVYGPVSCLQGNGRVGSQVPPSQKNPVLSLRFVLSGFRLFFLLFFILVTACQSLGLICLSNTV